MRSPSAVVEPRNGYPLYLSVNRAPVAQWIEQLTSDQQVGGSNPSGRASSRIDRLDGSDPPTPSGRAKSLTATF